MKYFYKFGYGTCEEHDEITVMHENLFTKEELDTISENGYVQAYRNFEHSKQFNSQLSAKRRIKELETRVTFQDLFPLFCEFLLTMGFEKIEYQEAEAEWVFGWASADVKDSWSSYSGPLTKKIQETLSLIKYTEATD